MICTQQQAEAHWEVEHISLFFWMLKLLFTLDSFPLFLTSVLLELIIEEAFLHGWLVGKQAKCVCILPDSISLDNLSDLICNLGENPIKGG